MKYCPYCGEKVEEDYIVCDSCGRTLPVDKTKLKQKNRKGLAIGIVSIVFGSLGFYPLIFIGSITGFITGIVCLGYKDSKYRKLGKIGFWLSIGSFILWVLIAILIALSAEHIDWESLYDYFYNYQYN